LFKENQKFTSSLCFYFDALDYLFFEIFSSFYKTNQFFVFQNLGWEAEMHIGFKIE